MALWTEWVSANETGGNNFTETAVVNLNGSYGVYASCALSKFNGNGGSPQAEMFISGYVQNGNPYEGSWNELFANGISSITVSLTVNNATAKGVLTITTDRLRTRGLSRDGTTSGDSGLGTAGLPSVAVRILEECWRPRGSTDGRDRDQSSASRRRAAAMLGR